MCNQLLRKGIKVVTTRPLEFFTNLRAYMLFRCTRVGIFFFHRKPGPGAKGGVRLGKNVRLQRLRCVSAELPGATVEIGDHAVIYEHARLAAYGEGHLSLGERAVVGDVRIYSRKRVAIGKRAIFSWNVFIQDFHPHPVDPDARAKQLVTMTDYFLPAFDGHRPTEPRFDWAFPTDEVILGDDIWFGANCTILPGVKIGSGSIVAAGAVVVKGEYPARSILAGNPAKVVKQLPAGPAT